MPLLLLFQTLFDIALLRKGPDALPRSRAVLLVVVVFWFLAVSTSGTILYGLNFDFLAREVLLSILALLLFSIFIRAYGSRQRLLQTISAILGVGGLISLYFAFVAVLSIILLGPVALKVVLVMFIMWSITAKGHIIARAIERSWYFGALIAACVFVVQWVASDLFSLQR